MTGERWNREQWEKATLDLLRRDSDRCGWCGKPLAGRAERHHRKRRRDGGDHLENLLLLHPSCHNGGPASVHGSPAEARRRGFIVAFASDVTQQPVEYRTPLGRAWFSLTPDGRREPFHLSIG